MFCNDLTYLRLILYVRLLSYIHTNHPLFHYRMYLVENIFIEFVLVSTYNKALVNIYINVAKIQCNPNISTINLNSGSEIVVTRFVIILLRYANKAFHSNLPSTSSSTSRMQFANDVTHTLQNVI